MAKTNPIIDQEFQIAVGDCMKDIVQLCKEKNYNVFVAIAALEMVKSNLILELRGKTSNKIDK